MKISLISKKMMLMEEEDEENFRIFLIFCAKG